MTDVTLHSHVHYKETYACTCGRHAMATAWGADSAGQTDAVDAQVRHLALLEDVDLSANTIRTIP